MGQHAGSLPRRARGIDRRKVRAHRGPAKSISSARTFGRDINDHEELLGRLREMCARVGKSLRRREMVAWTVTVKFRWADFTTFTRQRSLTVPVDRDDDIYTQAEALWLEHWPPGQPVRLMGVGVSRLEQPEARQLAFEL
jgi:DNA polymerase-4